MNLMGTYSKLLQSKSKPHKVVRKQTGKQADERSAINKHIKPRKKVSEPKADISHKKTPLSLQRVSRDEKVTKENGEPQQTTATGLDVDKFSQVIHFIQQTEDVAKRLTVRLSPYERETIKNFIQNDIEPLGVEAHNHSPVNMSKLLRYCLLYILSVHRQEFVHALGEVIAKKDKLVL